MFTLTAAILPAFDSLMHSVALPAISADGATERRLLRSPECTSGYFFFVCVFLSGSYLCLEFMVNTCSRLLEEICFLKRFTVCQMYSKPVLLCSVY